MIRAVRAYVMAAGGADYHARGDDHWATGRIATPMSRYPEYRASRSSWGLGALGTLAVEVEDEEGQTGVGVTVGGPPGAWIVEHHLSRFVEGRPVDDIATSWDQMWRSTMHYGRKGLVVNVISAVNLAMWDLLGKRREMRVCDLLGGPKTEALRFYATTPDAARARELGFDGAKVVLRRTSWEGAGAIDEELRELGEVRRLLPDFPLRLDCWMALDLDSATRLMEGLIDLDFYWMEEAFPPEDYWSYAELRKRARGRIKITTGEHEGGLDGFRMLLEMGGADVLQPDVSWCGGLSELLRISELADAHGVAVVPHGSSVYGYEFMMLHGGSEPAEFLMMHPTGAEVVPMFAPLFADEPAPESGGLVRSSAPGFGVHLNPDLELQRPFPREERSGRALRGSDAYR